MDFHLGNGVLRSGLEESELRYPFRDRKSLRAFIAIDRASFRLPFSSIRV